MSSVPHCCIWNQYKLLFSKLSTMKGYWVRVVFVGLSCPQCASVEGNARPRAKICYMVGLQPTIAVCMGWSIGNLKYFVASISLLSRNIKWIRKMLEMHGKCSVVWINDTRPYLRYNSQFLYSVKNIKWIRKMLKMHAKCSVAWINDTRLYLRYDFRFVYSVKIYNE